MEGEGFNVLERQRIVVGMGVRRVFVGDRRFAGGIFRAERSTTFSCRP